MEYKDDSHCCQFHYNEVGFIVNIRILASVEVESATHGLFIALGETNLLQFLIHIKVLHKTDHLNKLKVNENKLLIISRLYV